MYFIQPQLLYASFIFTPLTNKETSNIIQVYFSRIKYPGNFERSTKSPSFTVSDADLGGKQSIDTSRSEFVPRGEELLFAKKGLHIRYRGMGYGTRT